MAGDRIISVDGRPLDPDHTFRSLRDGIAMRDREDRIVLGVMRGNEERQIDIPMPVSKSPAANVQPLALLQQLSELSRTFAFASYVTWQPARGLIQTRLDLRLPRPTSPIAYELAD